MNPAEKESMKEKKLYERKGEERMKSDLIERYIYAVTRRLPGKTRRDVAKELQTLIADMLEERCGEITPTEKDIRVVLTELGTPAELYEKYDNDSHQSLIGQPYYSTYKFVLKIVLICVALGMTIAYPLSYLADGKEFLWWKAVWEWLGMMWSALLSAFGILTALFVFFERREIALDGMGTGLDNLPPVPEKKERISKAESVLGIVFSIAFVTVFLACPQIFVAVRQKGEAAVMLPIFDTEVVRSTWYVILLFGVLGIVSEIVKLLDGKYTKRVVVTTVVTDLLSAVLAFIWLCRQGILNPQFTEAVKEMFEGEGAFIGTVFANFQYFFLSVMVFALVLDSITTVVKWLRIRGESTDL